MKFRLHIVRQSVLADYVIMMLRQSPSAEMELSACGSKSLGLVIAPASSAASLLAERSLEAAVPGAARGKSAVR